MPATPHVAELVLALVERIDANAHGAYNAAGRVCPLCGHRLMPRQNHVAALKPPSATAETLSGDTGLVGGERGGPVDGLDS